MELETAILTYEEMGIRIELPTGWLLEADEQGRVLTCVAEDEWEDDGYAASITIERQGPIALDDDGYDPAVGDELDELAGRSLDEMSDTYRGFVLLGTERRGSTVVRSYEFELSSIGRRVRQTQGLVSDGALYVVNATAPLVFADDLQSAFLNAIHSLRRVDV